MQIDSLAERLLPLFPALDKVDRRLSLGLYRALARGEPVPLAPLFRTLDIDAAEGERRVAGWPGVYRDAEQRVIGFWGLALGRMRHRLRVERRELFAWCAWDTLFLPAVLGARAEVLSQCQATGAPVRLVVGTDALESAEPAGLAVSFVIPEGPAVRADVITSFCHHVHFFASAPAARAWRESQPGAILLELGEAFALGRRFNEQRYGTINQGLLA